MLKTEVYELTKKGPVFFKNWLVREGLQLNEKEKGKMAEGFLAMLSHKFKLPCSRIVLSLQYLKLNRKNHESAQTWMDRLQTKAAECDNSKYVPRLTEQFIK